MFYLKTISWYYWINKLLSVFEIILMASWLNFNFLDFLYKPNSYSSYLKIAHIIWNIKINQGNSPRTCWTKEWWPFSDWKIDRMNVWLTKLCKKLWYKTFIPAWPVIFNQQNQILWIYWFLLGYLHQYYCKLCYRNL